MDLVLDQDPRREEWIACARKGVPSPEPVYKASVAVVREGEEERSLRHTITSQAVDRERDVIVADGVQVENFLRNPVVLWAHDRWSPPIAKATQLEKKGQAWQSTSIFAPGEVYSFADTIYRLSKWMGFSAVSIGFRALEWSYDEDRGGISFREIELLEYSMVPVPAHQDALQAAKAAAGIDPAPYYRWCEELIGKGGSRVVPVKLLESIVAAGGTRKIFDLAGAGDLYTELAGKEGEMSTQGSEPEKKEPETSKGLRIPVSKCSACGEDHLEGVEMQAKSSGGYWGTCPKTGDPVTFEIQIPLAGKTVDADAKEGAESDGLTKEVFDAWLQETVEEARKEAMTRVYGAVESTP